MSAGIPCKIAGVVLAGGRSSRMGGPDKAFLALAGRPLVECVVGRLAAQVDAVALNANQSADRYGWLGCTVIPDGKPGHPGPLAGIAIGLRWARNLGFSQCITAAVDMPFFPADLVARLSEASDTEIAVASSNGRPHPVFGLWSTELSGPIDTFLETDGKGRVMDLVRSRSYRIVDFPFASTPEGPVDSFFNINTPDDLERAEILAEKLLSK